MRRYTLARFTALGTLLSRHGAIEGAEGTVAAARDPLVAAARHGTIEGAEGAIAATRVLVTATRHGTIAGAEGTIAATRVLVTATRHGTIAGQKVPSPRHGILSLPPLVMPRSTFSADVWARDRMGCRTFPEASRWHLRRVPAAFQ